MKQIKLAVQKQMEHYKNPRKKNGTYQNKRNTKGDLHEKIKQIKLAV